MNFMGKKVVTSTFVKSRTYKWFPTWVYAINQQNLLKKDLMKMAFNTTNCFRCRFNDTKMHDQSTATRVTNRFIKKLL